MITYSKWSPTGFDPNGLALEDRQEWLVIEAIGRDRDTEGSGHYDTVLTDSNWHTALKMLRKHSRAFEIHRFGHWACGWFEIIIVKPGTKAEAIGREIEEALANYPILDESDHSEREYEAAADVWRTSDVRERCGYIKRCGADPEVSIFAARRDELPEGIYHNELLD